MTSLVSRFPSLKPSFEGNHNLVGVYFASSWCPDCVPATEKLKAMYENQQPASAYGDKVIEIVYISSDRYKEEMDNYRTKLHPWLAIPFDNATERNGLKKYFGICAASEMSSLNISHRLDGIPSLVVLDVSTQDILTTNGIAGLNKYGSKDVCQIWLSKRNVLMNQIDKHNPDY
jgi:thiol-disulfide isomerase/thioredoxin